MTLTLEGQEAIDYLQYMQEQAKSIDEADTYTERLVRSLPTPEEIFEPSRERHVVTQGDLVDDINSEIPQPTTVTVEVPNEFPSTPTQPKRYHRWSDADLRTLHACASSSSSSIRALTYVRDSIDTSLSVKSVHTKLNTLGYKVRKGYICRPN